MIRLATCLVLAFVALTLPGKAAASIDAPHSEGSHVSCASCHGENLEELAVSPFWNNEFTPADIDDTLYNRLCLYCHTSASAPYTDTEAPRAKTHSSLTVDAGYGDWTTQCIDCHDPHNQAQKIVRTADRAKTLLASGQVTGCSYDALSETSTLAVSAINYKAGWNAVSLAAKTLAGRRAILVPNLGKVGATFPVDAINDAGLTITASGDACANLTGNPYVTLPVDYGIIYGQLIRQNVTHSAKGINAPVKFVDKTGANSFVDGDTTYDGVCQVCHTLTRHFRRTGEVDVEPAQGMDHDPEVGGNCMDCHRHENGFKHGGTGTVGCVDCHGTTGKHAPHLALEMGCAVCHDIAAIPLFKDGQSLASTTACAACHQDGKGGAPNKTDYKANWDNALYDLDCNGCHNGRPDNDFSASCDTLQPCTNCHNGSQGSPQPPVGMQTGAHAQLVSTRWVRQYHCRYCHSATVDAAWNLSASHTNGAVDVAINAQWAIVGKPAPSYEPGTEVCANVYCHSDGTTVDPEVRPYPWTSTGAGCNACHGETQACSTCHADGRSWTPEQQWLKAMPMYANTGPGTEKANSHFRHLFTDFTCDECHALTVVGACATCHCDPPDPGDPNCVDVGNPGSAMNETAHIDPAYHVNKAKNVSFSHDGTYNPLTKTCSGLGSQCHSGGTDPVWGGSVNSTVTCVECHGAATPDVDDFNAWNGTRAKINLSQWASSGHGRPAAAGNYPQSNNPPANFPDNGCWYCHDNTVYHQTEDNPYRLRQHQNFNDHFDKQCVFCHMTANGTGSSAECLTCHNQDHSLAPYLGNLGVQTGGPFQDNEVLSGIKDGLAVVNGTLAGNILAYDGQTGEFAVGELLEGLTSGAHARVVAITDHGDWGSLQLVEIADGGVRMDHAAFIDGQTSCLTAGCHPNDATQHKTGAGTWTQAEKDEIKSQYVFMGVCLRCHDDDSTGECQTCHQGAQYTAGFDPDGAGTDFAKITPELARASSFHFGHKHYADHEASPDPNVWKGGKFCWDCHDPHGDANIYMVHDKVAVETYGAHGEPSARRDVVFTRKQSGTDYAKSVAPYNGICNVCHTTGALPQNVKHYSYQSGDNHNAGRVCTTCHEHRFTNSHASGEACGTCHGDRPVPRHTAFGQPRDCTKCHDGTINKRMNIMGQFRAPSHHVQRDDGTVKNQDCFQCHWEATVLGLIDVDHHEGYNYKTYASVPDAPVDLVIWGEGARPITYDADGLNDNDTAIQFTPQSMLASVPAQRAEVVKTTPHCLGCHSDQNNDTEPFDDCKTPRQYAWDGTSIGARYVDTRTTSWGKYTSYAKAAPKNLTKALSAHGNAEANQGGFDPTNGIDGSLASFNTRPSFASASGLYNVHCFDCHSSHGSYASGVTSSYATFNGTKNGANLKETQAGKGGYTMSYKAQATTGPTDVNFHNAGADQCFDCHETASPGATPWGYATTFGATAPIVGYKDNPRFLGSYPGKPIAIRSSKTTLGGHLHASSTLTNPGLVMGTIDGLCSPCHDPHGISPTLSASDANYAVPLLKGTWLTSPYQEDQAMLSTSTYYGWSYARSSKVTAPVTWRTDRNTFVSGDLNTFTTRDTIVETDSQFAGLCLRCHPKSSLTDGTNKNTAFKSLDRVHEAVKGWGSNAEHSFPCSKCHEAHASGLPRLMTTNCLDWKHRGNVISGGAMGNVANKPAPRVASTHGPEGIKPANQTTATFACHDAATAAGGAWNVQQWNNITQW
ncbi:MAG: CxxxxCH/CxxCH domain-containing protein [Thermodesulfobacteriota bacterium]